MMHAVARAADRAAQTAESETVYVRRSDTKTPALPQAALRILEAFDGQRTLAEVCDHAQISVSRGLAVVKKLSAMGILDVAPTATLVSQLERSETLRGLPALRSSGFSEDEEAFFASEVQPIDECDLPFESLSDKVSHFISDLLLRVTRSEAY